MSYLHEFQEFSNIAKRVALGLLFSLILATFFLSFPSSQSISSRIFRKMSVDLVPEGVELVSLSIWSSAISDMEIAFALGFFCVFPWFAWMAFRYFSPGLYEHERRTFAKVLAPSFILFLSGAMFAYYFFISPTFSIMYRFAERLGVKPLIDVSDFVGTVVMLMIISGIIFLLPIIMLTLNITGFVDKATWGEYWRHAFFAFFAFSAVITPDGTGITMLIFTTPMILLYLVGWGLSKRY
ncbi:MAG: twin-arginine translocase subunit TatC [bacterium]|nr:twin-arginine translocase subunit TatC [bacterium]